MPGNIVIRGDGVAALCCVRLLGQAGLGVTVGGPARPKLPAIMLSEGTQKLLQDVFDRPDMFEGMTRIRNRMVAWGPGSKPMELPHSAVVLSEQELLKRIPQPHAGDSPEPREGQASWTIFASRPLPQAVEEHHFGSRIASVAAVKLKEQVAGGRLLDRISR